MRLLFVAVLALSLMGCIHSSYHKNVQATKNPCQKTWQNFNPQTQALIILMADNFDNSNDIVKCQEQGGQPHKVGMLLSEKCIITYPDAGKVCTKGDDCQANICEVNEASLIGQTFKLVGMCKATNNHFGCYNFIDDGQIQGICVD